MPLSSSRFAGLLRNLTKTIHQQERKNLLTDREQGRPISLIHCLYSANVFSSNNSFKQNGRNSSQDQSSAMDNPRDLHHNINGDEHVIRYLCKSNALEKALTVLSNMETSPSIGLYRSLLKACNKSKNIEFAKHVYAHLSQHSSQVAPLLWDHLVVTFANCGSLDEALKIFKGLFHRTVFSYSALISAFADAGRGLEALQMYEQMQKDGVEPNHYTFVGLLKACGTIPDLCQGRKFHTEARRKGFMADSYIACTLISMYGKCGSIADAEVVFNEFPHYNTTLWNAMLSAYIEQGQGYVALLLYRQMREENVSADELTVLLSLQICGLLQEHNKNEQQIAKSDAVFLEIGKALHADARKWGLKLNDQAGTTLISMYGKCGAIEEAESAFQLLQKKRVVSWNAMLSAYADSRLGERTLHLYKDMLHEGICPDEVTFTVVLQSCGTLVMNAIDSTGKTQLASRNTYIQIGQALHADARNMGYTSNTMVGNTLLTFYGKCGYTVEAETVFYNLNDRDIISWTALLSLYVQNDQAEKALKLYGYMKTQCMIFDDIMFTSILQACSVMGDVEICRQVHFDIVSAHRDLNSYVTATLIHAYGSSASILDADETFIGLQTSFTVLWNAYIAGHAAGGSARTCLWLFEELKMFGLMPTEGTFTAIFLACSHSGFLPEALHCFASIGNENGLTPSQKHYGVVIDLLGRAGDFIRLENMLKKIEMQNCLPIRNSLLSSCRIHGNIQLAELAFDETVTLLEPEEASLYILMSNIYAEAQFGEHVVDVEIYGCKGELWELGFT